MPSVEEYKEEIETWTKDATSLVHFIQNEFLETIGTDDVSEKINDIDFEQIFKYALEIKKINPNENVNGKSVFEYLMQVCVDGCRFPEDDKYKLNIIKIFIKYKADISNPVIVSIIVGSKDTIDDYNNFEDEEDLDDDYSMKTRCFLLKNLWNKFDCNVLEKVKWNDGIYLKALKLYCETI